MIKNQSGRASLRLILATLFIAMMAISIFFIANRGLVVSEVWQRGQSFVEQIYTRGRDVISPEDKQRKITYKFAVLADSHEDVEVFPEIVDQIAAREDLAFVVHLGDLSNAGELPKLTQAKNILDRIEVPVYVLPGDHDLNWVPEHDLRNFRQVFGYARTSYAISQGDHRLLFIDNSDLNNGIDESAWRWLNSELETNVDTQKIVFMSTPLSNPYLGFKTMGSQSEEVRQQASELGQLLAQHDVRVIFSGDTHTFSQFKDESTGLDIVTVGAAGTSKNPLPMYVLVEIFSDGNYNVTSVPYAKNK